MPTQSIDLETVTEANFNGTAVEQINLNGTGIWTKPSQGPSYYIDYFTVTSRTPWQIHPLYQETSGAVTTQGWFKMTGVWTQRLMGDSEIIQLVDNYHFLVTGTNGVRSLYASQMEAGTEETTINVPYPQPNRWVSESLNGGAPWLGIASWCMPVNTTVVAPWSQPYPYAAGSNITNTTTDITVWSSNGSMMTIEQAHGITTNEYNDFTRPVKVVKIADYIGGAWVLNPTNTDRSWGVSSVCSAGTYGNYWNGDTVRRTRITYYIDNGVVKRDYIDSTKSIVHDLGGPDVCSTLGDVFSYTNAPAPVTSLANATVIDTVTPSTLIGMTVVL